MPLATEFLALLEGREELLVSSRGPTGRGTVRMWFAVSPAGQLYLLTPSFTVKAQRWLEDPWVRLTVPDGGPAVEGTVARVAAEDSELDADLLVSHFAMAGATTREALRWMVESGSHLLLLVSGKS